MLVEINLGFAPCSEYLVNFKFCNVAYLLCVICQFENHMVYITIRILMELSVGCVRDRAAGRGPVAPRHWDTCASPPDPRLTLLRPVPTSV